MNEEHNYIFLSNPYVALVRCASDISDFLIDTGPGNLPSIPSFCGILHKSGPITLCVVVLCLLNVVFNISILNVLFSFTYQVSIPTHVINLVYIRSSFTPPQHVSLHSMSSSRTFSGKF